MLSNAVGTEEKDIAQRMWGGSESGVWNARTLYTDPSRNAD